MPSTNSCFYSSDMWWNKFLIFTFIYLPLAHLEQKDRSFLNYLLGSCKCKCGVPNREARLIGGEYLRGYEFPWAVLIQVDGGESTPGTLINDKYVITGAAQLMGLTAYDIKVTLAQFDRCVSDISSANVSVEKILIHPDYTPDNEAHNIALVKLTSQVTFSRKLSPICLSFPGHTYLGQVATLIGWHEDENENGTKGCRPKKIGLPVLGRSDCSSTASDSKYVTIDKGCVGVVGATSLVCKEDGGGPVMFRSQKGIYEIIGILSGHNHCKENLKTTALYTNINDHLAWITKNTRDACYCYKT